MSEQIPLAELQGWLMAAITQGDAASSGHLIGTERFPAASGLSVYAGAYTERLVSALGDSFPVVLRVVGESAFRALALAYLRDHPPSGADLGQLGALFPAHMDVTRPPEDDDAQCIVDLASFERAIDEVFDGPGHEGAAGITLEALSTLEPAAWSTACLEPSPSLRVLSFAFPVDTYWGEVRALSVDATVSPLPGPSVQHVALMRRDYVVRRLVLEPTEYRLLSALVSGRSVGAAIEEMAASSRHVEAVLEASLQRWFARWMGEEVFVALHSTSDGVSGLDSSGTRGGSP